MRKKYIIVGFLIVAVFWLGACDRSKKQTASYSNIQTNTISIEADSYNINIKYPFMNEPSLDRPIDKLIKSQVAKFTKDSTAPKMNPDWKYELWIDYSVDKFSKDLFSFKFTIYQFTGGAHGSTQVMTRVMDRSGKEYRLNDVFLGNSKYLERLSTISATKILEQLGRTADKKWVKSGTLPKTSNFSSFILIPGNMVVYFGQYQVAPYADGIIEVKVPLKDLNDILKAPFTGK
jgi:peptidoglycan-N-acetylglucosamine deacetylase